MLGYIIYPSETTMPTSTASFCIRLAHNRKALLPNVLSVYLYRHNTGNGTLLCDPVLLRQSHQPAALSFLVNWLRTFFFGIVCLILIFRCNLLSYAVKFIVIFLFLELFLSVLIHVITSRIVFVNYCELYMIQMSLCAFFILI